MLLQSRCMGTAAVPHPSQLSMPKAATTFRQGSSFQAGNARLVSPASDFWVVGGSFLGEGSTGFEDRIISYPSGIHDSSILGEPSQPGERLLCTPVPVQSSCSVCLRMQVLSHSAALAASRGEKNHRAPGELTSSGLTSLMKLC